MRKKGFTLIELVTVMGIIVVLGYLITKVYTDYVVGARVTKARTQMAEFAKILDDYYKNEGAYPKSLEFLVKKGILTELPSNPWGGRYVLNGHEIVAEEKRNGKTIYHRWAYSNVVADYSFDSVDELDFFDNSSSWKTFQEDNGKKILVGYASSVSGTELVFPKPEFLLMPKDFVATIHFRLAGYINNHIDKTGSLKYLNIFLKGSSGQITIKRNNKLEGGNIELNPSGDLPNDLVLASEGEYLEIQKKGGMITVYHSSSDKPLLNQVIKLGDNVQFRFRVSSKVGIDQFTIMKE